jgi:hypothetical protein
VLLRRLALLASQRLPVKVHNPPIVAGVLSALPAPRYWWMAVIGIYLGERLYAFIMLPETRAWILFGLIMNIVTLTWVPATIGGLCTFTGSHWLAKRARRRNKTAVEE